MNRPAIGLLLVVVWVLLWDRVTTGQVLAGVLVAVVLLAVLRPPDADTRPRAPIRPLALARLVWWFARQVVVSNVQVSRAVLFPDRYVRPGVVTVPLRTTSPHLAALIGNITALSPGMQPVGGTDEPASIDVHVLTLDSDEQAAGIVHQLEDLVLAAFGGDPASATDQEVTS